MFRSIAGLIAIIVSSGLQAETIHIERHRIEACLTIEQADARVACYDDLARDLIGAEPTAKRVDEKTLFGRGPAESSKHLQTELGVQDLEQIVSGVTRVAEGPYGKLVIELDNGQVWRQLDSARLPLDTGESVQIRKAGLGSFLLEKATGSRTIRVRRIDS